MSQYPKLDPKRKTGLEQFHKGGQIVGPTLLNFWQWYSSDLVSNATRGCLAEFIVASALGLTDGLRDEWRAFDLMTQAGVKIEVKSAAYLQSWYQKELSSILFSIRPTRAWDPTTSTFGIELKRQADLYVFCVLSYQVKDENFDPLDLDQWDFYLIKSSVLHEHMPNAKTITLKGLLRLNPYVTKYEQLRECVERIVA